MEVDAGGTGGDRVIPQVARLNIALYVAVLLCVGLIVFVGTLMMRAEPGRDFLIRGFTDGFSADSSGRAGTSVGSATVSAVPTASEADQERVAEQLVFAERFALAFTNIRYDDVASHIEAVVSMSTGEFLEQYSAGTTDLRELLQEAESVQETEVVWSAVSSTDTTQAVVILALQGTVTNTATEGRPQARQHRLQLDIVLEDDQWLVRDLQWVNTL
jgi:Mce-associated membrane protein